MSLIDTIAKNPYVTVRNKESLNLDGTCVVYWMQRSQRATDNRALNIAVTAANALTKPVVVFFGLRRNAHHANYRHYYFMLQGLADVAEGLQKRGVGFVLRRHPDHDIRAILRSSETLSSHQRRRPSAPRRMGQGARGARISGVLLDRRLGRDRPVATAWQRALCRAHYTAKNTPGIAALSQARRRRPRERFAGRIAIRLQSLDPETKLLDELTMDRSIGSAHSFAGGSAAAHSILGRFLQARLDGYAKNRNHPDIDGTSQLSPYLHFGHIGPHTVALAVNDADAPAQDRKAFLEEVDRSTRAGDQLRALQSQVRLLRCQRALGGSDSAHSCKGFAPAPLRGKTIGERRDA